MYYFYVLYSLKNGKLYKGVSGDVGRRFLKHSMGGTKSTHNRRPLVLIFMEEFVDKTTALKYENYTKTLEGGVELREKLIRMNIINEHGKLRG